jgi:hypothetical protein
MVENFHNRSDPARVLIIRRSLVRVQPPPPDFRSVLNWLQSDSLEPGCPQGRVQSNTQDGTADCSARGLERKLCRELELSRVERRPRRTEKRVWCRRATRRTGAELRAALGRKRGCVFILARN